MSKKHFNFKSSIRDWYIRAFPSDELGYRINPLATFAGAVKCMADGGDIYKYLGVGDSLVRENVFSKIAAITGVDYDAVYGLWLHHDEDECSRLVFLGDHPDCAVDRDWREQFDEVVSPSEQVHYDDLTERFGFFYDIDFSRLTFKTSLILSVKSLYFEGDVVDSALDWQADYLPCVCHRGGQGENDRWEYEPTDDYRPFTRPADIPESIFDKLCASQGTTIEKVVNDPVTKFERSFREDIFNSQQNSLVGLTVLATLPLDAFLDASLSMICRGDRKKAGTFTVKPGTYEPIMGIYDPINGCGGTAGIELDTDFDIDPRDIKYTMMEPRGGKWESDRIDLYTPQDCFGFSEPFAGRVEYSEKKPEIAVKTKPDLADLGRRASVAAGATVRDGVDDGGIKL